MKRDLSAAIVSAGVLLGGLLSCAGLTGCLVAGYSSGSGFWIWPGSLVVTLILILIWFLMRR